MKQFAYLTVFSRSTTCKISKYETDDYDTFDDILQVKKTLLVT